MPECTSRYQDQIRCLLQKNQIFTRYFCSCSVVVAKKRKSYYCDVGCKDVIILKLRLLLFGDKIFLIQYSVFQNNLTVKFC